VELPELEGRFRVIPAACLRISKTSLKLVEKGLLHTNP
jgi:hypothetical protein